MIDFSKLLYLPLDLPPPPNLAESFDKAGPECFFEDSYRNCKHLHIFMNDKKKGTSDYTTFGKSVPSLIDWLETFVFSWAGRGDVVVITTQPNQLNPSHIDCSPEKFVNTVQHKFRYVCQGKVDSLHFEHSDGLVTPTNVDAPFIMSGKWPHHMQNTDNIKYTLALGAPWDASLDDNAYMDLLTRSYEKYGEHYLSFDGLNLRQGWADLFEKGRGYEEQVERCINKNQLAF